MIEARFELIPGGLGGLIGSLVIIAFAVAVAMATPRSNAQRWFVLFAVSFGLAIGLTNINVYEPRSMHAFVWFAAFLGFAVATVGAGGLVLSYAGLPERTSSWWATIVPATLMLAFGAVAFAADPDGPRAVADASGALPSPWLAPVLVGMFALNATVVTGSVMLALWAHGGDEARVRQGSLVSTALVLYTGWFVGSFAIIDSAFFRIQLMGILLGILAASAAWLTVTVRGVAPAAARNAALFPLGFVLAGLLLNLQTAPSAVGLSRILMTAVLAYAIVRHKAFGIDAKLRFGISKGTVAAVILSVVFIASEGAQLLFGEDKQWLGLVVGGVVVFAISPLQQMADRLAERAVPIADPARPMTHGDRNDREQRYRAVVARFLRDGAITQDEQRVLAHLADDLGIGMGRAFDLRADVQAESRKATTRRR